MTDPLRLEWIVLGPRSQGRSYGVLRPGGRRLNDGLAARLDDVALAISAWAKRGGDSFAALLPLDAESGSALLMRCAFVGQAELGPVAMALGVLFGPAELHRLAGRPHRLLRHIPRPTARAADEPPIDVDLAQPYPPVDARVFAPYAAALDEGPLRVEVDDPAVAEPLLCSLLEAANPQRPTPSWTTSGALGRSGRFDPGLVDLIVCPSAEAVARPGDSWRHFAGGRFVEAPPAPKWARAVWGSLFQPDRDAMADDLRRDAEALAALEAVTWDPSFVDLEPAEVVARCLSAAFARLDAEGSYKLLAAAALQTHRLTDPTARQAACRGIAFAFETLVEGAPPSLAAAWLARYLPLADMLPDAPPALPARLALDLGALPQLEPPQIAELARRGLATVFASRTAEVARAGLVRDPTRATPLMDGLADALAAKPLDAGQAELLGATLAQSSAWPASARPARRATLAAVQGALGSPGTDVASLPSAEIAALARSGEAEGAAVLGRCVELIDASSAPPGAWALALGVALDVAAGAPR